MVEKFIELYGSGELNEILKVLLDQTYDCDDDMCDDEGCNLNKAFLKYLKYSQLTVCNDKNLNDLDSATNKPKLVCEKEPTSAEVPNEDELKVQQAAEWWCFLKPIIKRSLTLRYTDHKKFYHVGNETIANIWEFASVEAKEWWRGVQRVCTNRRNTGATKDKLAIKYLEKLSSELTPADVVYIWVLETIK